jgi:hypothetical protein
VILGVLAITIVASLRAEKRSAVTPAPEEAL